MDRCAAFAAQPAVSQHTPIRRSTQPPAVDLPPILN